MSARTFAALDRNLSRARECTRSGLALNIHNNLLRGSVGGRSGNISLGSYESALLPKLPYPRLALAFRRKMHVQRICEALWPESSLSQACSRLLAFEAQAV